MVMYTRVYNCPSFSHVCWVCLVFKILYISFLWCRKHLLLEVKTLPPDIQAKGGEQFAAITDSAFSSPSSLFLFLSLSLPPSFFPFLDLPGGPLSISSEVAQAFNLTGVKWVRVRRVDKKEVGLDMLEVRFKVSPALHCNVMSDDVTMMSLCIIIIGSFRVCMFEGGVGGEGEGLPAYIILGTSHTCCSLRMAQFFLGGVKAPIVPPLSPPPICDHDLYSGYNYFAVEFLQIT